LLFILHISKKAAVFQYNISSDVLVKPIQYHAACQVIWLFRKYL